MMAGMVHEKRAILGGASARYLEAGTGQPVLFIHAFPLNAEMWRQELERVPSGWRFIAPDLRGFGASPLRGPTAQTMDDYAGDLGRFMDALALETAVIAGLSMGGYIAFALFRLAPQRFRGLILADTRSQADSPEGLAARQAMLTRVRTSGARAAADDLVPKLLGQSSHRERPAVVAEARRIMEANEPAAIEAAIQALMTRPDSTPDLARIACPTLVLVGDEDTVTPAADAQAMHRAIRGSQLEVLPRSGHLSNLETPEEFSGAVTSFLKRAF